MKSRAFTLTLVGTIAAAVVLALSLGMAGGNQDKTGTAQPSGTQSQAPIPGLSRQPSPAARAVMLDPSDTAVLLLDHQTGLFQTVKDVPVGELRNKRCRARQHRQARQGADHLHRF